jgi:predicted RND superfamily exporter protein
VKIETNQIEWFPKKEDCYKSAMLLDKNLSGIGDLEIVIKGEKDALKEPDILKKMDNLSSEIEKLPRVKKVISLTDYVKMINKALKEDNPEYYKIPESKSLIAQELFLFTLSDDGREELDNIVTSDYSQGRIAVKTESMPSQESVILGSLLGEMAKEGFSGTGIGVTLTGTTYLDNLMDKYLLESQVKGFSLAFLSVIGVLFIAFWSVKYGGLSIIPNLLPIIFIIGIMGWSGITLNTGTVMVASVALGIVVDDTIHFISRFRKELKFNKFPFQDALRETTVSVGKAIIFTSVINIAGFLILLISGFQPTREFGMLIALTLFFAIIGDILVLPSVIIATRRFVKTKTKS